MAGCDVEQELEIYKRSFPNMFGLDLPARRKSRDGYIVSLSPSSGRDHTVEARYKYNVPCNPSTTLCVVS
jgi:hypothetical protein